MKPLFHKFFGTAIIVLLASCSASMDERRVFSYVILTDPSQNIGSLFKVTEADARRFAGLGKPGEEYRTISVADAEVYEYFGQVRARYGINDPGDLIVDQGITLYDDFLYMNWGWNGTSNSGRYSSGQNDSWNAGGYQFQSNKTIYYGFQ